MLTVWPRRFCVCSAVCKARPDAMEVNAILQYVADQLRANESYDLLVLKALMTEMTGAHVVSALQTPDRWHPSSCHIHCRHLPIRCSSCLDNTPLMRCIVDLLSFQAVMHGEFLSCALGAHYSQALRCCL